MRTFLTTTSTVLSVLALACAGCAETPESLMRGRDVRTERGADAPETEAAAPITLNGHIASDGEGTIAQGLAGSKILDVATSVDVMALGADGQLTSVAHTAVKPGGAFVATLAPATSPTGIFILRVKDVAGAIVGSGVVNGLPAFVKAFAVDATVDTTTSFKAEILVTLAKKGVPGVQNYLNVIDAYVDAQLTNSVALVGVVATDLDTLLDATSDAVIAAEDVIVAALKKAGIPVDLTALQKAQSAAVSGVKGLVTSSAGTLVTNGKNLVAALEAASAKAAAPIDDAIFNAIVNGGAAFSASLGKGAASKPPVTFAAAKSVSALATSLSTTSILDSFAKSGGSSKVLAAVTDACATWSAAVLGAKSPADLEAARARFTDALLGKGAAKDAGILGLLTKVIDDLTALLKSVDATLEPLAADLKTAFASLDCEAIDAALSRFDASTKDLPAKLRGSLSDGDAAAMSNALRLVQKQVTP